MKKLIIKTTAITLAIVLCAAMIAFGALSLFAPKICASFFDGVGNYSASVLFYKKHYQKTGDIKDLAVLIDKLDDERDPHLKENYLEVMLSAEGFDEFCLEQDKKDHAISAKEYYNGSYALILANNNRLTNALKICSDYVKKYDYTDNNPYRLLISDYASDANLDQLKDIRSSLQTRKLYLDQDEGKLLAEEDFKIINQLIQQKQETKD